MGTLYGAQGQARRHLPKLGTADVQRALCVIGKLGSIASRVTKGFGVATCHAVFLAADCNALILAFCRAHTQPVHLQYVNITQLYRDRLNAGPAQEESLTIRTKAAEPKLRAATTVFARIALIAPKLEVTGTLASITAMLLCRSAESVLTTAPRGALSRLAALCWGRLVVAGAEASASAVCRRGAAEAILTATACFAEIRLAAFCLGRFVVAGAQAATAAVGRGGATEAVFAAAAGLAVF
jgi:hypothetical protein